MADLTELTTQKFIKIVQAPLQTPYLLMDVWAELERRLLRAAEMEKAIRWALGEEGEFDPPENAPRYWWRAELRVRAALGDRPAPGMSREEAERIARKLARQAFAAQGFSGAEQKFIDELIAVLQSVARGERP